VNRASYAIIGGRRIGKTSILYQLHSVQLPRMSFRTIYHTCGIYHSDRQFLAAKPGEWKPDAPRRAPATWGELLKSPPRDKPLVLLLDEADKLVPADESGRWQVFSRLRALANSGHAQVILSGEHTLRQALRNSHSPLFNFVNEVLVGPLARHSVEALVTQPLKLMDVELADETKIVRAIYDFTGGHPNIVQRLCDKLIHKLNEQESRRITLNDVRMVIQDPGFQRDDFLDTYWEKATPLEKIISLLMADDKSLSNLRTISHAVMKCCTPGPTKAEIDDALQCLVDLRAILIRTSSGYKFAVKAFPSVVAGTVTAKDILDVQVEKYQELRAQTRNAPPAIERP
jgi:hypothetical protein